MKNHILSFILITFLIINSSNGLRKKRSVNWTGNWAFACDFYKSDLTSAKISGAECGGRCAQTSGCTHFTWTTYNGGTCWMKSGPVSKDDAYFTNDYSMVCGVENPNSIATSPVAGTTTRYWDCCKPGCA